MNNLSGIRSSLNSGKKPSIPGVRSSSEIELRSDGQYVQWRYPGPFSKWVNLIAVKDLTGDKGERGQTGFTGEKGDKGDQGIQGDTGPQGEKGETGERGATGADGEPGKLGPRGPIGETGLAGLNGKNGKDGTDAREIELRTTATHIQWRYAGSSVWRNLIPLKELIGPQGKPGVKGEKGQKGDDGEEGDQGERGERGPQGFTGPAGMPGIQGPKGDKGDPGEGGGSTVISNEIPVGTIDGINNVFTTSEDFEAGSTAVYTNGLRETLMLHYTESDVNEITMDEPPQVGDIITLDYVKVG